MGQRDGIISSIVPFYFIYKCTYYYEPEKQI